MTERVVLALRELADALEELQVESPWLWEGTSLAVAAGCRHSAGAVGGDPSQCGPGTVWLERAVPLRPAPLPGAR